MPIDASSSSADAGAIAADIERLRLEHPETRALYAAVARTLFFKYGVTPTANRLHQLVGKGSMSTAAAVLAKFWQELRKVSQLRLNHPALPEPLQQTGADLLAQLWGPACQQSTDEFTSMRADLETQVIEAEHRASLAQSEAHAATERAAKAEAVAAGLESNLREFADGLDQLDRDKHQLAQEKSRLEQELADAHSAAAAGRSAFTADLQIVRDALAIAEERARATEQRALREIDAERQRRILAIKEVERERDRFEAELGARTLEARDLRQSLDKAMQRIASLEASLVGTEVRLKSQTASMSELLKRMDKLGSMRFSPIQRAKSAKQSPRTVGTRPRSKNASD